MRFVLCIWLIIASQTYMNAQQGWWSARLIRNDGNSIPFTFEWKTEDGRPVWYIHNASEVIRVASISAVADSFVIQMPVFESQFRLKYHDQNLTGSWIKGGSKQSQVMPFSALPGKKRFDATTSNKNISGRWAVTFSNSKPGELSVAELKQTGTKLTGTFLNPFGDYRYLEGAVTNDSLFLSGFDGGHALFFSAGVDNNKIISGGTFFSGAVTKDSWKAIKNKNAKVPEEAAAMYVKPGEEGLHFTFKDLEGNLVSITDDQFKNKVVIVQLMGSWCPNCMDETAFLSDYYNKNKDRGIEIIALAYEYSTDWERSVKSLKKFQERFNVRYTILNTGVSVGDSLRTEKTLPELTPIKFFPSSVIIDKKGKIRKLDTGFNGPGTGAHYFTFKKDFEELIDRLLKED